MAAQADLDGTKTKNDAQSWCLGLSLLKTCLGELPDDKGKGMSEQLESFDGDDVVADRMREVAEEQS